MHLVNSGCIGPLDCYSRSGELPSRPFTRPSPRRVAKATALAGALSFLPFLRCFRLGPGSGSRQFPWREDSVRPTHSRFWQSEVRRNGKAHVHLHQRGKHGPGGNKRTNVLWMCRRRRMDPASRARASRHDPGAIQNGGYARGFKSVSVYSMIVATDAGLPSKATYGSRSMCCPVCRAEHYAGRDLRLNDVKITIRGGARLHHSTPVAARTPHRRGPTNSQEKHSTC